MKRRNFITNSTAAMAMPFLPKIDMSYKDPEDLLQKNLPLNFTRDGLDLPPTLYALLLEELTQQPDFAPDSYGLGGMIHDFEAKVAEKLGKEKAIFIPTGTLANHIAFRQHCRNAKRAIVQYQSHVNRDSGDCVTNLSGINLLTLGGKNVTFTKEELLEAIEDNAHGKVKTPIGVLSLETPVRRNHLRRIPFDKIEEITTLAKSHGIALHLDGARLFIDAAFSGRKVKDYTRLFDTVYLSLYKSFNSISGAILAGDADLIKGLHNERRMFGGGLPSSWGQIAIANYFFDGYEVRYQKAKALFTTLTHALESKNLFQVKALKNGSNVHQMFPLREINPVQFRNKLLQKGIKFPKWNEVTGCFYIKMNDSLVYQDIGEVVRVFEGAV